MENRAKNLILLPGKGFLNTLNQKKNLLADLAMNGVKAEFIRVYMN